MKGKVHVYTGDGKGKTTAALGLSIRAAGAGLRVFFAQFIKADEYSEIKALKRFSDIITVEQFGLGGFIGGNPSSGDVEAAQKGVARVMEIISTGKYDVVVLDEANTAVTYELISEQDLLDIIDAKSKNIELVITGRDASARIIEKADLVTQMKAVKHYFQNGVQARVGIEK
ncbi:MAG: cob(I)yrinic acid a,c-diamide adenosyltransferase [Desulfobacterales bacterium]|jgi:cob(I)alamin adenosyltransferase